MRKFVFSDLHGEGKIYKQVMNYLDHLSEKEEISLYINGDLIDRGNSSGYILLDVMNRIKSNRYPIIYLAGNHELMMYEVYEKRKKGIPTYKSDWYRNGGCVTEKQLNEVLKTKEEIEEVVNFISKLKIYHKFSEKIENKRIVLVHASCPIKVEDECNLNLKSNEDELFLYLWMREKDPFFPFPYHLGNPSYFTIIGHTNNNTKLAYQYHKEDNYLNIDGGYYNRYQQLPLVEIKEEYLKILTFHEMKGLIAGNYFTPKESIPYEEKELKEAKKLIMSRP